MKQSQQPGRPDVTTQTAAAATTGLQQQVCGVPNDDPCCEYDEGQSHDDRNKPGSNLVGQDLQQQQ